jgi:hypothetical protein
MSFTDQWKSEMSTLEALASWTEPNLRSEVSKMVMVKSTDWRKTAGVHARNC